MPHTHKKCSETLEAGMKQLWEGAVPRPLSPEACRREES